METPEIIKPLLFESEDFIIHPFRRMDMDRHDQVARDIYELYSDPQVLKYSPEKKLRSIKEANDSIFGIIADYTKGRNTYFITSKKNLEVLGVFYLISPSYAKSKYPNIPSSTWLIEYYLKPRYWGMSITPNILKAVIDRMVAQSVTKFGAMVFRDNINSIRVLSKINFTFHSKFDFYQDLYTRTE